MDKNKIEIKDLYLIFGSERNKAFKMLKKGKSKSELLKETGCTCLLYTSDAADE